MTNNKDSLNQNRDITTIIDNLPILSPLGRVARSRSIPFKRGMEDELERALDRLSHILAMDPKTIVSITQIIKITRDLRGYMEMLGRGSLLNKEDLFEVKLLNLNLLALNPLCQDIDGLEIRGSEEIRAILDPRDDGLRTFYIYEEYSDTLKDIRSKLKGIIYTLEKNKINLRHDLFSKGITLRNDLSFGVSKDASKDDSKAEYLKSKDCFEIVRDGVFEVEYRYIPSKEELEISKSFEELKALEEDQEGKVLEKLSKMIAPYAPYMISEMEKLGKLDLEISKAMYAVKIGAKRPKIHKQCIKPQIQIKEGFHPLVKEELSVDNLPYTPVTIDLKNGVCLITGANMGGKSVTLRMIDLIVAMVSYGMYVPGEVRTGLFDHQFLSIGDHQSSGQGLSSFGGEMASLANTLSKEGKRLIILDELASGTNPKEGVELGRAIIHYFNRQVDNEEKDVVLISSHYDGLLGIDGVDYYEVKGLRDMDYSLLKDKSQRERLNILRSKMDYTLERVRGNERVPRDAMRIARAMGIPDEVVGEEAERS